MVSTLKSCSQCRTVAYCSRECQSEQAGAALLGSRRGSTAQPLERLLRLGTVAAGAANKCRLLIPSCPAERHWKDAHKSECAQLAERGQRPARRG